MLSLKQLVPAEDHSGRHCPSTRNAALTFNQRTTDMCGIETKDEMTLMSAEASSCACCSTDATTAAPADAAGDLYRLEGLTCGYCVQSVETAVSAVPGVDSASVNLVAGGASTLTVSGNADHAAILAAVSEAGYAATGG